MITALVIAFSVGWKLTFVILCFVPLMMFSGAIRNQKQGKAGQSKDKGSLAEKGGQVKVNLTMKHVEIFFHDYSFSMLLKLSTIFEQLSLFI